ncbi:hypothetical protein B0H67DRAFT_650232 [Lasiosphaeris hirsuta]|uniref:Uncharacterized protein n=1 Tax=Lasiosphaeris hirsuta TaxID=260670 RepID=A0AA40DGG1_9PEZI|nr:hypothetical protein B0H67DRAFT_650232 [Lasiosphaeris hirsuta]
MSGFEVAGLALGAFPLLLEAAKGLHCRYNDAQAWWQYERMLEDFIASLEEEQIKFDQILEILIDPLVDLTSNQQERLRRDPSSDLWGEPDIQSQLRRGFAGRETHLDWFMRELCGLNMALGKL